jgi:hypothetical protein
MFDLMVDVTDCFWQLGNARTEGNDTFARNLDQPSLRDWTRLSRHFVPGYPRFNPSGINAQWHLPHAAMS